jgi:hypothetical protein
MKLVTETNYKSTQPEYGYDTFGNLLTPPDGYQIVPINNLINKDDMVFDIYSGWLGPGYCRYASENGFYTESRGRWTTYARKS